MYMKKKIIGIIKLSCIYWAICWILLSRVSNFFYTELHSCILILSWVISRELGGTTSCIKDFENINHMYIKRITMTHID